MKNILLLAMSTLGREIKDNYYTYVDGNGVKKTVVGQSQLEPITHMVSREQKKNGERLDKIIILETQETLLEHDGRKSAVGFYKERVGNFLDADVEYIDIPIDERKPAEGIAEATKILLQEYEEQKKNNDKVNLWIDTQGGFRDVAMVFNAIISLLREQGIEPKGIYSIRYTPNNTEENPCPIIDQTRNYDIFKFVSAMQEFMDYGKATGLKKYYGEENAFVQAVDGIADAIQMCQPKKFEDAIRRFADYLESEGYKNDDPYLQVFAEFMKSDYGILLEQPDNTIEQIRWCVKKEFYQQAVTIYIENMPKHYHVNGILTLDADTEAAATYGKNAYAKAFYDGMYDELLKDENDIKLEGILKSVRGSWEKIRSGNVRKNIERHLNEELAKVKNDKMESAISTLIKNIKERFDDNGNLKPSKLKDGEPNTIRTYINDLWAKRKKRQELLYGAPFSFKSTWEKKMMAIKSAKEKEPGLVKIMEYYLAMKILRNRMNHASEVEIDEGEQAVIEFLKSEQVDVGMLVGQNGVAFDYRQMKRLIIEGLQLGTEIE